MRTLYSLDEIVLIPSTVSEIDHRGQCNCFDKNGKLPLFIAPMCCLVDEINYDEFYTMNFNVILPRTVPFFTRIAACTEGKWIAISLEEGFTLSGFIEDKKSNIKVCIDIANGHQKRSYELCRHLRNTFPNMEIMVGNIANPWAYLQYAKAGANYVRLGIGSGHVCTTSVQTGIHYPIASLISHCNRIKRVLKFFRCKRPEIVADGGFGYIDQIVKAVALGADYVMIGRIAASFPQACGEVVDGKREYYGMSTEKAQQKMHPEPGYVCKHSEGTVRWIPIIDNTLGWINDFTHALRSSMSYCNAKSLSDYCGKVKWAVQSPVTFKAYIKS